MRRVIMLLLTAILATGCSARPVPAPTPVPPPPAPVHAPSDQPRLDPAIEAQCPPPPPPETSPYTRPPEMHVLFGVREDNPTVAPGQPLHLTAYLKNAAPHAILLDPQAPVLELRHQAPNQAPAWSLPLTAWAGITLQPGQELTQTGEWPGGEAGYYALTFDRIHFTVACSHENVTTSGGGTRVHVPLPAGQARAQTVTPHAAVLVDDIAVRVDSVVMEPTGTQVTLWVSRVKAPTDLSVAVYVDGKTPLDGFGLGNYAGGNGDVFVVVDREPVPVGAKSLTVEVSDVGLTTPGVGMTRIHGPWRIMVPLPKE